MQSISNHLTDTKPSATSRLPVVFTAQSKEFFYCRDAVCEFVFKRQAVPINPFRVFEYFLGDRVDRHLVRQGNNNLIQIVDEVWVFGNVIADGVLFEIFLAQQCRKPIHFFTIHNRSDEIREISPSELAVRLKFEQEVHLRFHSTTNDLLTRILGYDPTDDRQLGLFES